MLVIYHAYCNDGFTAAWAVWRVHGENASYQAFSYQANDHRFARLLKQAEGQPVVIVDFCFQAPRMLELLAVARSVHVIDHHKSTLKYLEEVGPHPKLTVDFKLEESGASLAWQVYHSNRLPKLVQYVRDRDLWANKLPHGKEVHLALTSTPKDFEVWDSLDISGLVNEGRVLLRQLRSTIEEHSKHKHRFVATIHGKDWDAIAVNAPHAIASDTAETIAKDAAVGIGIVYQVSPHSPTELFISYSFRVAAHCTFDASEFCGRFGGGGHEKASGVGIVVPTADAAASLWGLNADSRSLK